MRRSSRGGRPSLLGTAARTAVIAGTATAVSGNVASKQQAKASAQHNAQVAANESQQALTDLQNQVSALQTQQFASAVPAAAPSAGGDFIAQLERLAQLKNAGILNDAEFEAAKAKLLAG